jgi:hypothetical protein
LIVNKALQQIRRSLLTIAEALEALGAETSTPKAAPVGNAAPAPRRKAELSPARMKALKLQGAYMGALRSLGPRQKTKVKALRATKGIDSALRLAQQLAKRR